MNICPPGGVRAAQIAEAKEYGVRSGRKRKSMLPGFELLKQL